MRITICKFLLSSTMILVAWTAVFANDIAEFMQDREIVTSIYFKSGKSLLTSSQHQQIESLKHKLQKQVRNGRLIRIEGFASPAGKVSDNLDLSMRRAIEVFTAVETLHLTDQIFLTGFGEKAPETAKMSEERRVDIVTYRASPELKKLFHDSAPSERFVIQ